MGGISVYLALSLLDLEVLRQACRALEPETVAQSPQHDLLAMPLQLHSSS